MSSHGCACQRLDAIESTLIRTRALLAQQEQALLEVRGALNLAEAKQAPAATSIEPLEEMEKRAILRAVQEKGAQTAAKLLGIGKTTLYRKLHDYGFDARTLQQMEKEASA